MNMWRNLSRFALDQVRSRAGYLAYSNPLYSWSLGGNAPEGFAVILPDLWPVDAQRGRDLCSLDHDTFTPHHDFAFLRDLRALGGDQARRKARESVLHWLNLHTQWEAESWRPDLIGQRLTHWIQTYEFFGASADDEFQDEFFDSVARQARHLSRILPERCDGVALLQAIRGLSLAGLACAGQEDWLRKGLDLLEKEAQKQILSDGCHISRSPTQLLTALQVFLDIRNGLLCGTYPVPEALDQIILRMAQALRFLRYPDKHLAVFNGAQEGDERLIDAVLARVGARKNRTTASLAHGGYERLSLGRSLLMVDSGTPPPRPYDRTAHAAPLAFEFIYGKERVFVNCGTHPYDPVWQDALRGTAAHNALDIDYRNVCEIGADGHFMRKPRKIVITREETRGAHLLEGSHDGYVPLNGITHRRRFYLGHQGHDLRGEENLTCSVGLGKPVDIAIRFHLHPRVQVSLIRDNQEALLRLPGGSGWRFFNSTGDLTLENSIYLGEGARPRKTKQLVISGTMNEDYGQIKWALQREGN